MVSDKFLAQLEDKEYRDAFIEAEIRTGLAYRIRVLRKSRGLSQEALGHLVGMTQGTIGRLEDPDYGKFTLSTLIKLAAAFDVALVIKFATLGDLLDHTEDLSPKALDVLSHDDWLKTREC